MGIVSGMLLVYNSVTGIMNASYHGTKNIFDSIMLPFSILLLLLSIVMLIQTLRNVPLKSIIVVCATTIAFVVGLLFLWFAIVKSDRNIFYGITAAITLFSAILNLNKQ